MNQDTSAGTGDDLRQFVKALPKCELHVHLEGSLRPETLRSLATRNGVSLPDDLTGTYQFGSFNEFARLFMLGLSVLRTEEDFAEAVGALASELAAQNVTYAEVTTTAYTHLQRGVPARAYRDGLNEGRRLAATRGVEIAWIVDIPRSIEPAEEGATVDFLLSADAPDNVVALGLGGPEHEWPPHLYADSFDRARAAGLLSIPHAGETDGPERVREALDLLHADRIGHGIRAADDPELLDRLAETGTPLEVCVTSNVLLGIVPAPADHPITTLRGAGVSITVNSDDPAYFMTTLTDELVLVAEVLGLGRGEVVDLVSAGFAASGLPDQAKRAARADLQRASG